MIDLSLHQYPYRMEPLREPHQPSSSPTTTPSTTPPLSTPESTNTSFAFLVHSQHTIPHNLPPNVDNKPLARQRRRRTSPEDQAILEDEFQRDSKPDKEARQRIVERVALGEKEVQIWFQNRRQTSRRKSRPLLAHEIVPHLQSSSTSTPTHVNASLLHSSRQNSHSNGDAIWKNDQDTVTPQTRPADEQTIPVRLGLKQRDQEDYTMSNMENSFSGSQILPYEPQEAMPTETQKQHHNAFNFGRAQESIITSLTNNVENQKQNDASITDEEHQTTRENEFTRIDEADEAKNPTKNPSGIRLSLTSAGNARVLTGDESSPSPPSLQSHLGPITENGTRGFRRSRSMAGLNDKFEPVGSTSFMSRLQRIPSGRSRDSRAWEFWCDSDSRNELAKKAEQEQTGSAADAISLMRSNSKSALRTNFSKGNMQVYQHDHPSKRLKNVHGTHTANPRRLGRAKSSIARLQGAEDIRFQLYNEQDQQSQKGSDPNNPNTLHSPSGDSDKENRTPQDGHPTTGLGITDLHRQPTKSKSSRPALGENRTVPSQSNKLGKKHNWKNSTVPKSNGIGSAGNNPESDAEIAEFMRMRGSSSDGYSPSFEPGQEDMDCIQGLLSLSQGNWR